MTIQSQDAHPRYWVTRTRTTQFVLVPRQKWAKYAPGDLIMTVQYKVPILGTKGETCLCERFSSHQLQTTDLEYGYKFYRQKLASYNARLDARHQRVREQNRAYFDYWAKMR